MYDNVAKRGNMACRAVTMAVVMVLTVLITAARERCDVTVYSTADGLSSNLISCAAQDSAGLLWFGTWNGLCCFDGYRFISFPTTNDCGATLPTNRIQTMKPGADRKLWCVTYDQRLYAFDSSTCLFADYSQLIKERLGIDPAMRNIYPLPSGDLYVVAYAKPHTLIKISRQGEIIDLTSHYSPAGEKIYEVESAPDGTTPIVYTSSAHDGIALKYIGEDKPVRIEENELRQRKQRFVDNEGHRWEINPSGVTRDNVLIPAAQRPPLAMNVAATMGFPVFLTDRNSTIWLAADGEPLSYFDEAAGSIVPVESTLNNPSSYDMSKISKWFVDNQSNIWSMGQHYLCRISPAKSKADYIETGMLRDVRGLRFTAGGDVEYDGTHDDTPAYSLFVDSKGRRWEGYKAQGLYMTTPEGVTRHFTPENSSLEGSDVFDVFEDSRGNVWVACYDGGFNLFNEKSISTDDAFFNTSNTLSAYPKEHHIKVRRITETPDGVMILSTAQGLVAFSNRFSSPSEIKFVSYEAQAGNPDALRGGNVMQTLVCRDDGRIYISTMGGGLFTLDSGQLLDGTAKFSPVEGTFEYPGIIQAMIEDLDGDLWLARESTLQRFNPATGQILTFSRRDFGRDVAFSEALPAIDLRDGRIAMGAYGGYVLFNPKEMTKSDYVPRILFSTVQYHGEDTRHPILYADELDVPANRRNLTISFSALDYQDNSLIRYAYRLDDDPEWHYVDEGHSASFNPLPAGHHTLYVRSTNADGVWVDNTASLHIYAHPTFWETPWALLLYIAVIAGILFVVIYIRRMRWERQRDREAMERRVSSLLEQLSEAKSSSAAGAFVSPNRTQYQLPETPIEDADKQLMERLMEYAEQHISDPDMKISDMASHLALGRTTLTERVKEITGMPPADFIRYLRIQRACRLISTTDQTLSQIAYAVGFSDPNYFSKAFKRATGQTPTAYRSSTAIQVV